MKATELDILHMTPSKAIPIVFPKLYFLSTNHLLNMQMRLHELMTGV